MSRPIDLRRASLVLLWIGAAGLFIVGAVSFVAPVWASTDFPWKVGPFLAMTIGGWSLGTATMAVIAARNGRLETTYPILVYVWLFGAGQGLVVLAFLDKLQIDHLLTKPYLIGIGALALSGVLGVADWWIHRPDLRGARGVVPRVARAFGLAFSVGVGLIALGNLVAGPDGAVAHGDFFPEALGLFSIKALAAFFFALSMSGFALFATRDVGPYLLLGRAGMALIVTITVAALVNLSLFDITGKPGGLLYLGAYIVVGALIGVAVVMYRPRVPEGQKTTD